ncbi:MAG: hypothetical protein GX864_03070, partial [Mollicutes bacterium]|nr:hypothetical protein [Mollicutes bacterium]
MVEFIIIDDDLEIQRTVERIIVKFLFGKSIEFNILKYTKYDSELQNLIDNNDSKR